MARKTKSPSINLRAGEMPVLVFQGGGALGSYQAGVYQALAAAGIEPEWVAGISIGAINAAIIAGNRPEDRVERLRTFWEGISSWLPATPLPENDWARMMANRLSAGSVIMTGVPGFFAPRVPPALWNPPGTTQAISYYDTSPLKKTLLELVDFDLLNDDHGIRLSLGAVDVETGNFAYFDSAKEQIEPEHIMASGALPPGFPPVEIGGRLYWDGGLVSNTPLQYVLDDYPRTDMCIFQVDLFSARGPRPETMLDVAEREKDIRYSSRTRLNTDAFMRFQEMRRCAHRLLNKLPPELADDPDVQRLQELRCDAAITVVHLINKRTAYQSQSKDYEFSRRTMVEHWGAGEADVAHTFFHKEWFERDKPATGVQVFDLSGPGHEHG